MSWADALHSVPEPQLTDAAVACAAVNRDCVHHPTIGAFLYSRSCEQRRNELQHGEENYAQPARFCAKCSDRNGTIRNAECVRGLPGTRVLCRRPGDRCSAPCADSRNVRCCPWSGLCLDRRVLELGGWSARLGWWPLGRGPAGLSLGAAPLGSPGRRLAHGLRPLGPALTLSFGPG